MPERIFKVLEGVTIIERGTHVDPVTAGSGFSLLFAPGTRPSAIAVEEALTASDDYPELSAVFHSVQAQVVSRHDSADGCVELLASGLSLDVHGLAPSPSCNLPPARHMFGLASDYSSKSLEVLDVIPGPHLAKGGSILPVVKVMAGLANELAQKLTAQVICFRPTGSWMAPSYFDRTVSSWLGGGAFPALGLTAIIRHDDGTVQTDGLAFFIGKEMRVAAKTNEPPATTIKNCLRLIDQLVQHGPVKGQIQQDAVDGSLLLAEAVSSVYASRIGRKS